MLETYIPLYRKYRPQAFGDLVGQDVVSTVLANALTLSKISHAYLFCGPRGTGKTSSARIFAKSLNCEQGPTPTPCQVCPSCVSITQGNALDVTEIDAASNNGVDSIRDLTDKVQFSPLQGKFKIYIIDEVHMLSTAAFNALLKTLEEPPPNVVFIFATTEPHKILPTIISRCQRFDFARITRQQIEDRVRQVAEWENIRINPEAARLIARHARGGMRDALGLLDQVSVLGRSDSGAEIQPEDVRAFVGILEEDLLFETAQGILDKDPQRILGQVRYLQDRGVEPVQMTKELTQHFRNLLIAKTCGPNASTDELDIAPDLYARLVEQAKNVHPEELPQFLMRLSALEGQLRHSHQPQLWFEVALLDLCYREEMALVRDLQTRLEALESALQQGGPLPARTASVPAAAPTAKPNPAPVRQPEPRSAGEPKPALASPPQTATAPPAMPVSPPVEQVPRQTAAVASADTGNLSQLWLRINGSIEHMPTRALLKDHFSLLAMDEAGITIGYANDTIYGVFCRTPEKQRYVEQAIQKVLGQAYKLRFQLNSAPVSQRPAMATLQPEPPAVMPETPQPTASQPVSLASADSSLEDPAPTVPPLPEQVVVPPQAPKPPAFRHPDETDDLESDWAEAKKFALDLLHAKPLD